MELLQSSALPLGYVAGLRISGWRESNPRVNLGKVAGYHYITPAEYGPSGSLRRRRLPLAINDTAMRTAITFSFLLAAALSTTASAAETWRFDPGHSSATFSVRHLVVTTVRGVIPLTAGGMTTEGSTTPTSVEATLDAAKISTNNDNRDADLRGKNWLDVDTYPTIAFKSSKIVAGADGSSFDMTGDLTIHGVTKAVTLAGKYSGSTTDQRGHKRAGYEATTKIDRRDFGLNWAAKTPGGDLVAANEVDITLDVEAVAQ